MYIRFFTNCNYMLKVNIKYLFALSFFLFTLGVTTNSEAQNCSGFEKRCEEAPKYFTKSALSRSFSVRKGRKLLINQTFFGDREYFVSVCGKKKIGDIHLRIIADDENKMILFDNAANNFKSSQIFVVQNTMKVKIELSAPYYFDNVHSECAGIQIHYHQSNKD